MASFETYGKCRVNPDAVSREHVLQLLTASLIKYYSAGKISATPSGLRVNGNLKGMFERAITKADVEVRLDDGLLSYRVTGSAGLGGWPWVWFFLGFFTGFTFFWFFWYLGEYVLSRDRPKRYFEEAFRAVQYQVEALQSQSVSVSVDR